MAKYRHDTVVPDSSSTKSKKDQVTGMFDQIAFRYDLVNRFLSMGIDISWRKKALKELKTLNPQQILDIATGTGDMAIMTYKALKPQKITGIDISEGMLEIGRGSPKRAQACRIVQQTHQCRSSKTLHHNMIEKPG